MIPETENRRDRCSERVSTMAKLPTSHRLNPGLTSRCRAHFFIFSRSMKLRGRAGDAELERRTS